MVQRRQTWAAGRVPLGLKLPGGLGRQRLVRITRAASEHIAREHPEHFVLCLEHMPVVLADPKYLGYRPAMDVAVKFIDDKNEAWVSTAHPLEPGRLTRRLRAGTMQEVGRGP